MPADGTADRRIDTSSSSPLPAATNGNANGYRAVPMNSIYRLRLNPNNNHRPDSYEDLNQSEFTPLLYSSLERYLPPNMLNVHRETKLRYMREILRRYSTDGERNRMSRELLKLVPCYHCQLVLCFSYVKKRFCMEFLLHKL